MHVRMSSKFLPLSVLAIGLLFLTLLCRGPTLCQATDYYVTPTDSSNPDCPVGEPCFTVDHYAREFSSPSYQESNVTVIFLQGTHSLTKDLVTNHINDRLVLRGISDAVVVLLNANINLGRSRTATSIVLRSLKLVSNIQSHSVVIEQPESYNAEVAFEQVLLSNTSLSASGEGYLNLTIMDSEFRCSTITISVARHGIMELSILSSSFYSEMFTTSISIDVNDGQLSLLQLYNTTIEDIGPDSICKINQRASTVPACDLRIFNIDQKLEVIGDSVVNIAESVLSRAYSTGICLELYKIDIDIYIVDTIISNHGAGALYVSWSLIFYRNMKENDTAIKLNLIMKNCSIFNNTFGSLLAHSPFVDSSGISIRSDGSLPAGQLQGIEILIENTTFSNNFAQRSAIISLSNINNVITLHSCYFVNNMGTSIKAIQSTFSLSGDVSFENNIATKGGALSLTLSTMNIITGSNVVFKNNSVSDVGGAIYVEQLDAGLYLENDAKTATKCFYQLLGATGTEEYSLTFLENTATGGGDNVFGASLESYCLAYGRVYSLLAQRFFHFQAANNSDLSSVSSTPTRLCLCDSEGQFNCSDVSQMYHSVLAAPGEEFTISAVVVGSEFGTARGSVFAQFFPINGRKASLAQEYQYTQGIRDHRSCSLLKYSILSANHKEVIVLTTTELTVSTYADIETLQKNVDQLEERGVIPPQLLTTPVYVNVTMFPCPVGFILVGTPPRCDCYEIFKENCISCRVAGGGNGYVTRNGTQWVNASVNGENITGVFLHKYCPFGYCDPQPVTVDLAHDPDEQCAFNRSGILCGACKPGYSSVLGSSKCRKCSNSYLALLLVFAVAGILLVLIIKLLDLTVAHGTINGLIFYANIVWANQSILFPNDGRANGATMILKTFIAWLNLDFGIETCFFNGLDGYWKTWLQFVFPFYIWSIAGVIIKTMRHSTLLTRLFGNNSVSVLATLFLLSYSKLLRTIITALNVAYLVDYPDGYRLAVWSFDGNLKYCGIPHIFLFIFSLVILLALWMPYTAVLLSVQLLRRVSDYKIFWWVDRMKPIFDVYFSPLKDRHYYWFGVQLIARGILLIIFSQTSSNIPAANYVAMTTVSAALLFYVAQTGYLYKKLYVSFLETSFLLNLVLLGVFYNNVSKRNQSVIIYTSVGVAFLQFVLILILQLIISIKLFIKKHKRVHGEPYESLNETTGSNVDQSRLKRKKKRNEFRESLLESISPDE